MSFNDIFFMIIVPVAAIAATGLLTGYYWKSKAASLARRYEERLQEQEERIQTLRNSSDVEDDISRNRERLLFQWQADILELAGDLREALGEPQILPTDHEYIRAGKEEEKRLEWLLQRIESLKKAKVRIDPQLSFAVGYFLQKLKKAGMAEHAYREAMAGDPTAAAPRFNLGRLLLRTERPVEAIQVFTELRDLKSNDAEVYFGLGVALCRADRVEEGIDALITTIRLNPENAAAYTELAEAHSRNGDLQRAMEAIQVALKIKPRDREARLMQQELLLRQGDFDTAVRECEKYLNQKQDGRVYFNLAKAHVLSGDIETGLKVLRNAFQLDDSLRFLARDDRAFDELRENRRFKELLEGHLGLF
jgi:tetratricopeptide (TPR) repeat protein